MAQNNNKGLLFFIVFVGQDLEKTLTGDVYLGSFTQGSHGLVKPGGPTKGLTGAGASASQEAHSHGWQVGAGWWPKASDPLHGPLAPQDASRSS